MTRIKEYYFNKLETIKIKYPKPIKKHLTKHTKLDLKKILCKELSNDKYDWKRFKNMQKNDLIYFIEKIRYIKNKRRKNDII